MSILRFLGLLGLLFLIVGHVRCQQYDSTTDEDEDVNVESDDGEKAKTEGEEPVDGALSKSSPFVDVASHVVQLEGGALPSNDIVTVLVGFANTGKSDFIVDVIEGSFRYPQDYNYHIQNFTYFRYNRVVPPGEEVSLLYRFFIHESYHSRSLGLAVNVHYHTEDKEGQAKLFESAAFNETIRISEPLEGFDAETFFLYVLLIAVIALVAFGGFQMFKTYGKKIVSSKPSGSPAVEIGTQKASDVDHEWLPKELLASLQKGSQKKSPSKKSPSSSPPESADEATRQRKNRPAGPKIVD